MSSIIDAFLELLDLLDRLVKVICIILGSIMALVVMMQVVMRYLPVMTFPWTEELARYLMIAMAYLGSSCAMKRWGHVNVDMILNRLPPTAYKIVLTSIRLIVLAFLIYIAYISINVFPVVGRFQWSPTMGFPLLIPQSTIIIGTILMGVQLIGLIIRSLRTDQKEEGPNDD